MIFIAAAITTIIIIIKEMIIIILIIKIQVVTIIFRCQTIIKNIMIITIIKIIIKIGIAGIEKIETIGIVGKEITGEKEINTERRNVLIRKEKGILTGIRIEIEETEIITKKRINTKVVQDIIIILGIITIIPQEKIRKSLVLAQTLNSNLKEILSTEKRKKRKIC